MQKVADRVPEKQDLLLLLEAAELSEVALVDRVAGLGVDRVADP